MADAIEGGQTKVYMTVDWHRNGEQIEDPNAPEGGNGYCMDEYVLSPEIYEIESDGKEFPSLAAGERWFAAHYDGDDDDGGTTMFFLKFGDQQCSGIQSLGITVERLGNLETKDAERVMLKWYPGLMLQNLVSCSKVTGIDANGTVAA